MFNEVYIIKIRNQDRQSPLVWNGRKDNFYDYHKNNDVTVSLKLLEFIFMVKIYKNSHTVEK